MEESVRVLDEEESTARDYDVDYTRPAEGRERKRETHK